MSLLIPSISMNYLLEIQARRRGNLNRLLADYKTQRQFGDAVGLSVAQISHIVTGVREMGEEVARRIEQTLGLPLGWMDRSDVAVEEPIDYSRAFPADQAKLLADYQRLSPKHRDVVRELMAMYARQEQEQEQPQP